MGQQTPALDGRVVEETATEKPARERERERHGLETHGVGTSGEVVCCHSGSLSSTPEVPTSRSLLAQNSPEETIEI